MVISQSLKSSMFELLFKVGPSLQIQVRGKLSTAILTSKKEIQKFHLSPLGLCLFTSLYLVWWLWAYFANLIHLTLASPISACLRKFSASEHTPSRLHQPFVDIPIKTWWSLEDSLGLHPVVHLWQWCDFVQQQRMYCRSQSSGAGDQCYPDLLMPSNHGRTSAATWLGVPTSHTSPVAW